MFNKYFHENASPFTVSKLKALNRKWFGQHKRHSLFESAEGPNITIVSKPGQVDQNSLTDSTSSMWCSIERTWYPNISVSCPFLPRLKTNPGLSPKNFFDASKSWNSDRSHMSRIWKNPAQAFLPILPVQGKLVYAQTFADPVTSRSASPRNLITDVMTCLVPAQKAGERILLILAFWEYSAWCDILPLSCFRISAINAAWKSWHKDTYVGKVHVTRKHGPRTETLYKTDYSLARWLLCLKWQVKTISKTNAGLWPHWFCKLKTLGPETHRLSMAETFVFDKPIRHQYGDF